MANWKLTIRHGSDVSRQSFDDLDDALGAARKAADEVMDEGPLDSVSAIRDYEPAQIVNARIEISGKGFFSPPTAGIDIQGDLSVIPFAGGVKRQTLEGSTIPQAMKSLKMFLSS
ncbi:MAG: hypothetical protein KDB54_11605 [Solirubrobacterales bacterium]|nr:hypothetical protein [Solirubrobacterales bacterium]MCB0861285.1 hypothetical protein [Solirubrobacterales bacterium]HRV59666.1 hypothetical protein [Solirubrobacterales bacterium]